MLLAVMRRLRYGTGELGHAIELPHAIARPRCQKAPLDFRRAYRRASSEQAQARNVCPINRNSGGGREPSRH